MNVNHRSQRRGSNDDHSLMLDSSHRRDVSSLGSFSPLGGVLLDPVDDEVTRSSMLDERRRPSPKRQSSKSLLFNFFKRQEKNNKQRQVSSDKLSLPPSPTRKASHAMSLDLSRDATQVLGRFRQQDPKQHHHPDHLVGSFVDIPNQETTTTTTRSRRRRRRCRPRETTRLGNLGKSKSVRSLPKKPSFLPELQRTFSYRSFHKRNNNQIMEEEDEEPSTSTRTTIPISSSPSFHEQQQQASSSPHLIASESFHTAMAESPQVATTSSSSHWEILEEEPTTDKNTTTLQLNDDNDRKPPPMIDVAPGVSLPLRSSKETLEYMKRGEVVSHFCEWCGTMHHTLNDAEFVLCPTCRTVERSREAVKGGGVGLGIAEDWEEWQTMSSLFQSV